MLNKIQKIISIIVLIILIPILIVSLILIVKSYIYKDKVPSIFGYSPLIVLSGSMETSIYTGDLIIVKEVNTSSLEKGDVIAFFTDSSKKTIVTHRIQDIIEQDNKKEFVTKGDNNNTQDSTTVPEELVVGQYHNFRISGLGNVAVFLQTPSGMITAISIPVLLIFIIQFIQNRQDKKELEELRKEKNTQGL